MSDECRVLSEEARSPWLLIVHRVHIVHIVHIVHCAVLLVPVIVAESRKPKARCPMPNAQSLTYAHSRG